MLTGFSLTLVLAGAGVVLALVLVFRADLTRAANGRALAFVSLFLLPSLTLWAGISEHMERAKSTSFCLSCHVMEDYGKTLRFDDKGYLPAVHYLNNRIPRDKACYTCHTNYTMFGGARDKWRGLHHVWAQYFGTIPGRGEIKLYEPFHNRECLHCHAGARSFVEAAPHKKDPDLLQKITNNQVSCTTSRCHDTNHDVTTLDDATFWEEP